MQAKIHLKSAKVTPSLQTFRLQLFVAHRRITAPEFLMINLTPAMSYLQATHYRGAQHSIKTNPAVAGNDYGELNRADEFAHHIFKKLDLMSLPWKLRHLFKTGDACTISSCNNSQPRLTDSGGRDESHCTGTVQG